MKASPIDLQSRIKVIRQHSIRSIHPLFALSISTVFYGYSICYSTAQITFSALFRCRYKSPVVDDFVSFYVVAGNAKGNRLANKHFTFPHYHKLTGTFLNFKILFRLINNDNYLIWSIVYKFSTNSFLLLLTLSMKYVIFS